MSDEKMKKFEELASKRTSSILHSIDVLSNLANKSAYHYTDAHIDQIFSAIQEKVEEAEKRFRQTNQRKSSAFSFHDTENEVDATAEEEEAEENETEDTPE